MWDGIGDVDVNAYCKAVSAKPYAKASAKMSGGDRPVWDADMDYWLSDEFTAGTNPSYKGCGWDGKRSQFSSWRENGVIET